MRTSLGISGPALAKDEPLTAANQAFVLAGRQTEHEFKRLAELVRAQYGERGVDRLICEWVKPDQASQDAARAPTGGAALDLVFVIDTTGSMFDDIDAVKAAATSIVNAMATMTCARIGIVLYKDAGDVYVTRTGLAFTMVGEDDGDTAPVVSAIQSISVGGGGDFPEAVYAGLVHAIENQQGMGLWHGGTTRKAIILMGDAPPPQPGSGHRRHPSRPSRRRRSPIPWTSTPSSSAGFIDPHGTQHVPGNRQCQSRPGLHGMNAGENLAASSRPSWMRSAAEPPVSNRPPVLASIGNRSVNEGGTLSFTASATDPDAGQILRFQPRPGRTRRRRYQPHDRRAFHLDAPGRDFDLVLQRHRARDR